MVPPRLLRFPQCQRQRPFVGTVTLYVDGVDVDVSDSFTGSAVVVVVVMGSICRRLDGGGGFFRDSVVGIYGAVVRPPWHRRRSVRNRNQSLLLLDLESRFVAGGGAAVSEFLAAGREFVRQSICFTRRQCIH